jgi:hypothetical protein
MSRMNRMSRMDTITKRIENAFKPTYTKELLKTILVKSRATSNTQIGLRDDNSSLATDLDYYNNRYDCMNNDSYRNRFFKEEIVRVSKLYNRWLEIGPGADGFLTKLILDENPQNVVTAVEGSSLAFQKVCKRLSRYSLKHRLHLFEGLAGHVSVPGNFDVFISELLGHWASSEGAPEAYRLCGLNYGVFKEAIPRYFGTCILPVNLTNTRYLTPTVIGSKVTLFRAFPFEEAQLSHQHQLMEYYCAIDLLQRGHDQSPCITKLEWSIEHPSTFHGFCTYLVYGNSDQRDDWYTSKTSKENVSNNWNHIFIPCDPVQVLPGYIIRCTCTCDVFRAEPQYSFDTTVCYENEVKYSSTLRVEYKDIYTVVVKVKDLK